MQNCLSTHAANQKPHTLFTFKPIRSLSYGKSMHQKNEKVEQQGAGAEKITAVTSSPRTASTFRACPFSILTSLPTIIDRDDAHASRCPLAGISWFASSSTRSGTPALPFERQRPNMSVEGLERTHIWTQCGLTPISQARESHTVRTID